MFIITQFLSGNPSACEGNICLLYTSPAFIKDGTLYIPTAFCSYSGEALDKKTPLLRSMQTLDKEATKLLHIIGNKDVKHVNTTVGPEQE